VLSGLIILESWFCEAPKVKVGSGLGFACSRPLKMLATGLAAGSGSDGWGVGLLCVLCELMPLKRLLGFGVCSPLCCVADCPNVKAAAGFGVCCSSSFVAEVPNEKDGFGVSSFCLAAGAPNENGLGVCSPPCCDCVNMPGLIPLVAGWNPLKMLSPVFDVSGALIEPKSPVPVCLSLLCSVDGPNMFVTGLSPFCCADCPKPPNEGALGFGVCSFVDCDCPNENTGVAPFSFACEPPKPLPKKLLGLEPLASGCCEV